MTGNKKAATWFLFTTLLSIFNICTIRIFDGYNWPFYAVTANAVLSLGGLVFHMHANKAARKQLLGFGAVFAAGALLIAATFLFLNAQRVFLLLGFAALICGILGVADAVKKAKEKERALRALPESEALEEAAWDVFTAEAPKKEDVNDLTYIPVNEKTLQRKNGDLMILYRLLPEIAVQAWNRLHPSPDEPEKEEEEPNDPPHCDVQDQG